VNDSFLIKIGMEWVENIFDFEVDENLYRQCSVGIEQDWFLNSFNTVVPIYDKVSIFCWNDLKLISENLLCFVKL
jgi:hypothetical protein